MAVPTISSGALRSLIATAAEEGQDADAIAREACIDREALDDRDARVPLAALHAAWEALLRRAPRLGAAIRGAHRYAPGDYGLVGFVAMNSATLGEGLGHVVRYIGLYVDEPALVARGSTLELAYRTPFPDRLGLRMATEATLAELLHGARTLAGEDIAPREITFTHGPPDDTSIHESFFRCPVRFSAQKSELVFRAEDLARPLAKADPQLGAFLCGIANEALEKRADDPLDRVRSIVAEELQRGVPTLTIVAKRMATSERTLRRRLDESGTSFREMLDASRAELARRYVADPRLSLTDVAFMLGFSEPSAFVRAFKRWTGTTPAVARRPK